MDHNSIRISGLNDADVKTRFNDKIMILMSDIHVQHNMQVYF